MRDRWGWTEWSLTTGVLTDETPLPGLSLQESLLGCVQGGFWGKDRLKAG